MHALNEYITDISEAYRDDGPFSPEFLVPLLSIGMIAMAIPTLLALVFWRTAPYGRYSEKTGWGVLIPPTPAWMFQESPTLFWTVYGLMTGDGDRLLAPVNMSLLSMFAVHYINRALIYPFRLKSSNGTPLTIVVLAGLFCFVNGYMQAMQLTEIADYETEYLTSPQFVFGVAMFCCGMYVNIQADGILLNLRHPGQTEYSIPLGGMFRYVSGANFLGEMVEWIGFAIASDSLPATAFAVYTICNIFPRALAHHKWYQSKFGTKYPKRRKAVIPFIW